jgi:hypothetical protein
MWCRVLFFSREKKKKPRDQEIHEERENKKVRRVGIEPATSCSEGGRLIHSTSLPKSRLGFALAATNVASAQVFALPFRNRSAQQTSQPRAMGSSKKKQLKKQRKIRTNDITAPLMKAANRKAWITRPGYRDETLPGPCEKYDPDSALSKDFYWGMPDGASLFHASGVNMQYDGYIYTAFLYDKLSACMDGRWYFCRLLFKFQNVPKFISECADEKAEFIVIEPCEPDGSAKKWQHFHGWGRRYMAVDHRLIRCVKQAARPKKREKKSNKSKKHEKKKKARKEKKIEKKLWKNLRKAKKEVEKKKKRSSDKPPQTDVVDPFYDEEPGF